MRRGFLFDTSALSLFAPGRPVLPPALADRLRAEASRLYVPTIALAEIREGICKLRRKGAVSRADAIETWIRSLCAVFENRILPFGTAEAEAAGELADAMTAIGRHPGFPDVAIAAIARTGGLAIVTENIKHFEPLGMTVLELADLAR